MWYAIFSFVNCVGRFPVWLLPWPRQPPPGQHRPETDLVPVSLMLRGHHLIMRLQCPSRQETPRLAHKVAATPTIATPSRDVIIRLAELNVAKHFKFMPPRYPFLPTAQGKVLPREKFYPEKKSTPEEVYPGKNPQFLSNLYETWWKYSSCECFKFLQYQLDWIKIVDFFWGRLFLGVELFSG